MELKVFLIFENKRKKKVFSFEANNEINRSKSFIGEREIHPYHKLHPCHQEKGNVSSAVMDKIFETNSTFHVKKRTTGKVQFLFFDNFLLVLIKFLFWE